MTLRFLPGAAALAMALALAGCQQGVRPGQGSALDSAPAPFADRPQVAADRPAVVGQPPSSRCAPETPDGRICVQLSPNDPQPAVTATGYATEFSWTATNACGFGMQMSWGWTAAMDDGYAIVPANQSMRISCIQGQNGCDGAVNYYVICE